MKMFLDVVTNLASSPGMIGVCMRWPALIPVAIAVFMVYHL
jgi:hypothetical protein